MLVFLMRGLHWQIYSTFSLQAKYQCNHVQNKYDHIKAHYI